MNKRAATDHPILDVLSERWGPRAFNDRPVGAGELHALFEAARWAPSSGNSQPWNFVVATHDDADAHGRLLALLNDGNRRWAAQAPVLIITVVQLRTEKRELHHAQHDLGVVPRYVRQS